MFSRGKPREMSVFEEGMEIMSGFSVLTDSELYLTGRLDFLSDSHNVYTQNVAQIDTPGYKAKMVQFEGFVDREKRRPDEAKYRVEADILDDPTAKSKPDGNSVTMEDQVAKMTNNSIEYMLAIETLKKHLALTKLAVDTR